MGKGNTVDINSPISFYCKQRPHIQKGWHNLFCIKHKIDVLILIECIEQYRISHQGNSVWNKKFTLDVISSKFDELLAIVTEKTGVVFKKNPRPNRKHGYDEWFEESSMDGSFSYNGAADDF